MAQKYDFINEGLLDAADKYFRLVNYLSAAQLYLKDNFLLEEELIQDHIKNRLLGHWGTVPGINFIYLNLNLLVKRHKQKTLLVVGPGHGFPALLSNLYLEGTLGEFYTQYKHSKEGIAQLIKYFSWPGGFPSHANPETPGVILEGGELGYSLSTSFGAAFDNPDLLVACVIGDGEAETGPLATSWHSTKFLNPKESGAVLPIVSINKYKISGPTILGSMSNEELENLFKGYGYTPLIVEEDDIFTNMMEKMEDAYQLIKQIQKDARENNKINKPKWPVILMKSKKGWTAPEKKHEKMLENSFRSHGIPLSKVKSDEYEFNLLKDWLQSYKVEELYDENYEVIEDITKLIPEENLRIGMNKNVNNVKIDPLNLPKIKKYKTEIDKKALKTTVQSNMVKLGKYMSDVVAKNNNNIRIMCPDEIESNKLEVFFESTKRVYLWPVPEASEDMHKTGRVMEILSEHTLQGWLQGYLLTGRHGIFISYESFIMIISSMVDQYSKFLKQAANVSWRKPVPSLNIILTSTGWRQDHNGYSHQNPGFISSLLNDYSETTNIYFPQDTNTLLITMQEALKSTNGINLIIAGKRELPQYLDIEEAEKQIEQGAKRWKHIGNVDDDPDIVFAAAGDYATQEVTAAIKMLKVYAPELRTRFIGVSSIGCSKIGGKTNILNLSKWEFEHLFTKDKQIIFSYHGYAEDIKTLMFNHFASHRFHIHGYKERGTTTTPFDMQVVNECSRLHLAIEAIEYASRTNKSVRDRKRELEQHFKDLLKRHKEYISENGDDLQEIKDIWQTS